MQRPEFMLIDSRDRIMDASQSTSDFHIQFTPSLEHIKSLNLLSVSLPLTVYNVDFNNNKLYFSDTIQSHVANVAVGIYDNITILDAIKVAIEAEYPATTITVTYDYLIHRFVISSTLPIGLEFLPGLFGSIANLLGFTNTDKPPATQFVAENVSSLSVPEYYFINIEGLISCRTTNQENATFLVFPNVDSGQISHHNAQTHYHTRTRAGSQPLQTAHIQLKHRGNRILDINNAEWCFLVQIQYWD